MTRKRFIKLLMANGYQRNMAQIYAENYHIRGYSYEKAYKHFLVLNSISLSFNRTANALKNVSTNLKAMTTQLDEFKEKLRYVIKGSF